VTLDRIARTIDPYVFKTEDKVGREVDRRQP